MIPPFRRSVLALITLASISACAPMDQPVGGKAPLAVPTRLVISAFTVISHAPGDPPRLVEQDPTDQAELLAARNAQEALQNAIVLGLRAKHLPAEAGPASNARDNALLIQGQMTATEPRVAIPSTFISRPLSAEIQVLHVTGQEPPQFLDSLSASPGVLNRPRASPTDELAGVVVSRILAFTAARRWFQ